MSKHEAIFRKVAEEFKRTKQAEALAIELSVSPTLDRIHENNKCKVEPRGFFSTMENILPSAELYKHRAAGKLQKARRIRNQLKLGCWAGLESNAKTSIAWCLNEAAIFRALASQPIKINASFAADRGSA